MLTDDFDLALFFVADVTEVDAKDILSSCKKMEFVEARVLLYQVMKDMGYHPAQIATKVGKSKQGVLLLLEDFDLRIKSSPIFSRMYKEISNKLATN